MNISRVKTGLENTSSRLLGWVRAGRAAWAEFSRHDGLQAAAALSFYAFLSLFAMLILGIGILGLVFRGKPGLARKALDYLAGNLPGIRAMIEEAIETSINRGT